MAQSRPLERPADIYRPFTPGERESLTTFVADVRRLGRMRFFDQVPKTASFTWDASGAHAEMAEPDDEAVRAAITTFRQIYNTSEPTSASAILKILKRSVRARGAPEADEALADIKGLRTMLGEILDHGIGFGIVLENDKTSKSITPRDILDTYFHGHYLHSGNEKTKMARVLDDLEPWPRYTLYSVMWKLTKAYWIIANVAERALQTPDAMSGQAGPASAAA